VVIIFRDISMMLSGWENHTLSAMLIHIDTMTPYTRFYSQVTYLHSLLFTTLDLSLSQPHENRKVDKQPSRDTRRAKLRHDNSCRRATQRLRIPFSTSKQMTADMSEYFQSVSINTPCCNTYLFLFSFFARHSFLFRRTKDCSERTLKYRDPYMYLV
jgi:hypothetical protein